MTDVCKWQMCVADGIESYAFTWHLHAVRSWMHPFFLLMPIWHSISGTTFARCEKSCTACLFWAGGRKWVNNWRLQRGLLTGDCEKPHTFQTSRLSAPRAHPPLWGNTTGKAGDKSKCIANDRCVQMTDVCGWWYRVICLYLTPSCCSFVDASIFSSHANLAFHLWDYVCSLWKVLHCVLVLGWRKEVS